jgi:hypothetical protein
MGSLIEGSSFSGFLTLVEIGHIRKPWARSDGKFAFASCGHAAGLALGSSVPGADICTAAKNHHSITSSARESRLSEILIPSARGLEVDHRLELGRLQDWKVCGFCALENLRGVDAELAIDVW